MFYATNASGSSFVSKTWDIVFGRELGASGVPIQISDLKVESFGSEPLLSETFLLDPTTGKMMPVSRGKDHLMIPKPEPMAEV